MLNKMVRKVFNFSKISIYLGIKSGSSHWTTFDGRSCYLNPELPAYSAC